MCHRLCTRTLGHQLMALCLGVGERVAGWAFDGSDLTSHLHAENSHYPCCHDFPSMLYLLNMIPNKSSSEVVPVIRKITSNKALMVGVGSPCNLISATGEYSTPPL